MRDWREQGEEEKGSKVVHLRKKGEMKFPLSKLNASK